MEEREFIPIEEIFGDNYINSNTEIFQKLENYMHWRTWVALFSITTDMDLTTNEVSKSNKIFKSKHIQKIKEVGAVKQNDKGIYFVNPYLAHGSKFVLNSEIINLFKGSLVSKLYEAMEYKYRNIN